MEEEVVPFGPLAVQVTWNSGFNMNLRKHVKKKSNEGGLHSTNGIISTSEKIDHLE